MISLRIALVAALVAPATAASPRFGLGLRRRTDTRVISTAYMMHELKWETDKPRSDNKQNNLIQFRGKGDDYCAYMEPLKERLRKEMGIEMNCYEVWYDPKNAELFQRLDKGRCGGVPFFYNKKTKKYICGATTYGNLVAWATGEVSEPCRPPPDLKAPGAEEDAVGNRFGRFIDSVKAKGKEVMDGRSEEEEEDA